MLNFGFYKNLIKALTDLAIILSIASCKDDKQNALDDSVKTGLPVPSKDKVLDPGYLANLKMIHD